MKAQRWGILRSALILLSLRLILVQIALGMACFLLFSVWLNVPDASVLALVGSSLLGLVVFVGGALGETWLLLELAGQRRTRGRWIGGAFMLLGAVSLWLVWSGLVSHWSTYDLQVAGYLTSRLLARCALSFCMSTWTWRLGGSGGHSPGWERG